MTDRKKSEAGPTLLSGGNPQIPKGEGTARCGTTSLPCLGGNETLEYASTTSS